MTMVDGARLSSMWRLVSRTTWNVQDCHKRMCSLGINGEGKSRETG